MRARKLLALLVLFGALGAGAYGLTRTGVLALSEIQITGTKILSVTDVAAAAGVSVGDAAYSVDLEKVQARVEELPLVFSATVTRPSALVLRIEIFERVAVARVYDGKMTRFFDAESVEVPKPEQTDGLLVMHGRMDADFLQAALRSVEYFRGEGFEVVRADSKARLMINLKAHIVVLGDGSRLDEKFLAWRSVIDSIQNPKKLRVVDVSSPERPTVKVKNN